jgi:hypothetical protein
MQRFIVTELINFIHKVYVGLGKNQLIDECIFLLLVYCKSEVPHSDFYSVSIINKVFSQNLDFSI